MSEISMLSRQAAPPSSAETSLTRQTAFDKVVQSDIHLWDPNKSPLVSLLRMAKGKKAQYKKDWQYYWPEDEYVPNLLCINHTGGYDTDDVTLVVDSTASIVAGDVIAAQNAAGTIETMLVSSVTNTTTFVVTRGIGGTAIDLEDDHVLTNLNQAARDGGTAPEGIVTIPNEKYNYTQIMRHVVEATSKMRAAQKNYPAGDYLMWQLKKKGFEHLRAKEMTFLLGHRAANTSSYKPLTTTMGLWERLSSDADSEHIWNVNGTLTEDSFFENAIEPIQNTGGRKIMLCGKKIMNAFSKWAKGNVEVSVDEDVHGLRIRRYRVPILEDIEIIWHPWMDRQKEPSNNVQEGVRKDWGCIIDLDNIHYCYSDEWIQVGEKDKKITDSMITPVNQASNPLDMKYEIISVFGTQIMHPNSHQIFYGVDSYA